MAELMERPKQKELARLLTPSGPQELTVIAAPGETISGLVDRGIPKELQGYVVAFNHGMKIDDPDTFTIQESDSILLTIVPQGGGGGGGKSGILGAVLSVAVMVAAVVLAAPTGGASLWLAGATGMSATMAGAVIGVGVSMIGMMAIQALIPPPQMNNGGYSGDTAGITQSPTYSISGQSNAMRKYGHVARIYGTHKYFPTLAANPLISNLGTESKIAALYDFGLGDIEVTNLKIGDTMASTFAPELYWHRDSYVKTNEYLNGRVGYDQFSYVLKQNQEIIIRSKPKTVAFDIDLSFNRGLGYANNAGGIDARTMSVLIEYRLVGSTTWIPLDATNIKGAQAAGGGSTMVVPVLQFAEISQSGKVFRFAARESEIAGATKTGDIKQFPWGDAERIVGADGKDYYVAPTQWIKGYDDWNGKEAMDNWSGATFTQSAVLGPHVPGPSNAIGITASTTRPFIAVASMAGIPEGEYEIRVVKQTADTTDSRSFMEVALTLIKSYQQGKLLNLDKRHTMLEMRLVASEKVSGTIQNLNGICTSVLRQTTDGVNFTKAGTRNPAWIVLDILTGEGNPKPLPDTQIDWPSFIKLAAFCDKKKYYTDFVVDYQTTVQELLNSVLSTCHCSLMLTSSGKYGILIDEEQTTPRQLITPANSWGFTGGRTFSDIPHALLVTFVNPDLNWQKDERIVYADGYDENNATKFETLNTFGITNKDQAWRYGRYMSAQGIHRSEIFNVSMDIEHLVVQRGDLVDVS